MMTRMRGPIGGKSTSTGGYALAEAWCVCEPPLPVCARYTQEHRRLSFVDGLLGGLALRARLAVGLPVACHLHRRQTTFLHIDPRALLWPLLALGVGEQPDPFEREHAGSRLQADQEPPESD